MKIKKSISVDKTTNCAWGSLIVVLGIYYISMLYSDIQVTHQHSLLLLDCIANGSVQDFYSHSLEQPFAGWAAVYYIPIYVLFAVWNVPIWILCKLSIITPHGRVALLWIKLLVVLSVTVCLHYIRKILNKLSNVDLQFSLFYFLSSFFVVLPVFATAQYDSLSLMLTLWGIYKSIDEKKLSCKTLIIFSVAISFKLFALFPFVLVVLLKEKRIMHIIKNIMAGMTVSIISILPYWNDVGYQNASVSFNGGMLNRLVENGVAGGMGQISLFLVGAMLIYICAYCSYLKSKEEYINMLAWLGTAFYLVFVLFVKIHPYWIILMVPFVVILTSQNNGKLRVNMMLGMLMEVLLVFTHCKNYNWVYLTDTAFGNLALKTLPIVSDIFSIKAFSEVIDKFNLSILIHAAIAGFAASGVTLLVLNNPFKKIVVEDCENLGKFKCNFCWFRIICLVVYYIISVLITYFI